MTGRLDYDLARIDDARLTAVPGGHELSTTVSVPRIVEGDRLSHFTAVAVLTEFYEGWLPHDYQRAALRLYRAARTRLRDLATEHARESD
ncbi:hypothetical protein [Methylorubrum sp. SL192]|uniref:hypothetical protein n=1 Tax=Methylorubrum sp. SL192 TaxID=2995167 RepID=UPI0006F75992|nr:hypothetical protein [Methylorubrum sp. SL192]KQO89436.1 hypothetical protein ASF33_19075 [Methylobacterium sp. Leaf92]MCY1644943.1 hypothetical protein [Methylorubrum sp. SL192]